MKALILAGLLFTGCAMLTQASQDIKACYDDPACLEAAQSQSMVAGTLPGSFNPAVGGFVGITMLLIGLWIGGRKKRKKK